MHNIKFGTIFLLLLKIDLLWVIPFLQNKGDLKNIHDRPLFWTPSHLIFRVGEYKFTNRIILNRYMPNLSAAYKTVWHKQRARDNKPDKRKRIWSITL
jgi:hypothetical protein